MLEKLGEGLKEALRKITKRGYIDKATIDELSKDMQRTLLASDVDVKIVFELTKRIKDRSLNEKPPAGMSAREHVVNIVYEELVNLVGKKPEIMLKPGKILMIGCFGAGKTTSIGKLARFYQKKGLKPALIGCDVHRPAAMKQLQQLGEQIGVPVYAPEGEKNPQKIAKEGIEKFSKYDILIFDSSGRDALDKELATEIKSLSNLIKPEEILLTIPGDMGQSTGIQAKAFKDLVGITGVFLTKMDGTAKGGGAITSSTISGAPVKFIGTGEKMDALEIFEPERFISRLIGFGDIRGLLEKAKEAISPKQAEEMKERLESGKFTMSDFYEQLKSMGSMGLESMMGMMPGMSGALPKQFDAKKQEEKMKKWKIAIESMTKKEREDPEIINTSRISRIAKGAGIEEAAVRDLIKNFQQSKKVVKMISGGGAKRGMLANIMKKFKGLKM